MEAEFLLFEDAVYSDDAQRRLGLKTVHDWVFDPVIGFFPTLGSYQQSFGIYKTIQEISGGGSDCFIKYQQFFLQRKDPNLSMYVRFPILFFFCMAGIIIGLYGFFKFAMAAKHAGNSHSHSNIGDKKKNSQPSFLTPLRKPCLTLCFSFLFFACMNTCGLVFHCLLAIRSPYRILFKIGDQASTGIAGLFLGIALKQLVHIYGHNDNRKKKKTQKKTMVENNPFSFQKCFGIISVVIGLTAMFPICGEIIYCAGCLITFQQTIHLYITRKKWMKHRNRRYEDGIADGFIYQICVSCLVMLAVMTVYLLMVRQVCKLSKSHLNLVSLFFVVSDVGYFVVVYFASLYLEEVFNIQKKLKKQR